jgi:hypothetical protein
VALITTAPSKLAGLFMLIINCPFHRARDGYDWMNLTDDPVYKSGGAQKWHQLIIQYAVEQKDDPNYEWMKNFLRRYFFDEEGRICRVARSSTSGPGAKFADIIFFCKQASADTEFPGFL